MRDLADVVASIAQAKEEKWTYDIPTLPAPVKTIAIGLDGANLLYYEGYRIAMCGTITLYDNEGERLYTLYCAAAPEYGKQATGDRQAWLKQKLHDLKHEEGAAKALSRELEQASPGNNRTASLDKLISARTYFKNHWHQMVYPYARERNLPIGSGITEAA